MKNWLSSSLVVVVLSLGVTAQAHGGNGRGCAILPPYESPDPPGFNSANFDVGRKGGFHPYYSPLVPISVRWDVKELIPYYPGYCRKGKHGVDRCGAPEMVVDADGPTGAPFAYGVFADGAGQDDNRFWRMGGNGLAPYGTPQPPRSGPDLIDQIDARHGQPGPGCP